MKPKKDQWPLGSQDMDSSSLENKMTLNKYLDAPGGGLLTPMPLKDGKWCAPRVLLFTGFRQPTNATVREQVFALLFAQSG